MRRGISLSSPLRKRLVYAQRYLSFSSLRKSLVSFLTALTERHGYLAVFSLRQLIGKEEGGGGGEEQRRREEKREEQYLCAESLPYCPMAHVARALSDRLSLTVFTTGSTLRRGLSLLPHS